MKHLPPYMINLLCACLLLVCLFGLSCKKFVDVDLPIDKLTAATVFAGDETATAAVMGIYADMIPTTPFFSCGGTSIYTGLASDELSLVNTANNEENELAQNAITAGNGLIWLNFWLRAYKHIYHANTCIENLSASASLSPSIKNQLMGEARFVRAFTYFYLVNLFGDVPLVTATSYKTNSEKPRTAKELVYAQVITDLKEAKQLLPQSYPSPGRVRPNKWAATALLARVYLYQQNWAAAEAEATEVINAGIYSLETNPANVFLAGSTEAIWQLVPVEIGFNTTEARYFVPTGSATSRPAYTITPQLQAAFEPGDQRKLAWLKTKTVSGQPYPYPFKYKVRNIGQPVTEYYMMLRLAEQFLVRAEARAQLNDLDDAKQDLDQLRGRAGLPPCTASDQASLLQAIENERRVELFAEWGHRWLDLKRTNRINEVMSGAKPLWLPYAALFPIPQSERLRNPALTQNPGY